MRAPQSSNSVSTHFFTPARLPQHLGPTRSRFYSGYSPNGPSQASANTTVLYGLIGANLAVFGYGQYAHSQAKEGYIAPWSKFLRNMTLNSTDFRNGYWWTVVTANFTHIGVGHLLGNMITAYFIGGFLAAAPQITPNRFLIITMGSALTGAAGYLFQRLQISGQNPGKTDYKRGLGFSGALMGINTVAACLAPNLKVQLYGIIPVPLWALVTGYAVYDGYYLDNGNTGVAHAGHLGGLAFGLAYYFFRLRFVRY